MEGLIFIERLGRHGEVLERARHRLEPAQALSFGRAADSGVWTSDPHVAPHHADLVRGADGSLKLIDAGSINGIQDAKGKVVREIAVDTTTSFGIGNGRWRVIPADDALAMAAEQPLPLGQRGTFWRALGWTVLASGAGLFGDWLEQVDEFRVGPVLTSLIAGLILMLVWSAAWGLLTRLFAHEMRFARHLSIAAIGSLSASLLMFAVIYLGYALAAESINRFSYVGYWVLFAAICHAHLRALGSGHRTLKAGVAIGLCALAITVQSVNLFQPEDRDEATLSYVRQVAPPALRLVPVQSMDTWFAEVESMQAEVEQERELALERDGSAELDTSDALSD